MITESNNTQVNINEKKDVSNNLDTIKIEFATVIRVKDINKSIDFYCQQMGFIFFSIECSSYYGIRAYLKPFAEASTFLCLEQFLSICPYPIDKPSIYFEIIPGREAFDYPNYCDKLFYQKGLSFDNYDRKKEVTLHSVLLDPDGCTLVIEDGFPMDFE